ncbi:hypothetical protein H5P28_19310 [Ruficoccus amylovorans]|uniref:tRNA (Adenosine(37)-N6)-threonylcarbamoyltransferase complex dimerization subunit type 1 TsaB n=1 Tax=Ruficoccus amylovorans TaxID=1804625 RepID=A0A842HIT3_9BACT|nr:hypothetical protein [Ruficoccus amylovorans]MBC2596423.1 hypothetical protein [Ruficoccus amylovorans]
MDNDRLYLYLDASSVSVQAGLWRKGCWLAYRSENSPALESIFTLVQGCLDDAAQPLDAVQGFVHCEGPGSVLGIRLAGMAIRSWLALPAWAGAEVLAFRSLDLTAALVAASRQPEGTFHVISEARQTCWNLLTVPGGDIVEVEPEALDALAGPVFYLRQRKSWHTPPAGAEAIANDLSSHPELLASPGLLSPVEAPGLYRVNEPSYRTWTPERHR